MADGLWSCSKTWPNRYDDFGATGYILLHAQGMEKAVVIDVGCSTGEAMLKSKLCLSRHGIKLYTVGIDMSDNAKLKAKAKNNLDEFIDSDARKVDNYAGKADIVVCLNAVRYVPGDAKSDMITKCAEFLKPDGVLITGVSPKHRRMLKLEDPASSHPKKVCAGWSLRSLLPIPSDTRMMKRDSVLHYAGMIHTEWGKIGRWHKRMTRFCYGAWCQFSNHALKAVIPGAMVGIACVVYLSY